MPIKTEKILSGISRGFGVAAIAFSTAGAIGLYKAIDRVVEKEIFVSELGYQIECAEGNRDATRQPVPSTTEFFTKEFLTGRLGILFALGTLSIFMAGTSKPEENPEENAGFGPTSSISSPVPGKQKTRRHP